MEKSCGFLLQKFIFCKFFGLQLGLDFTLKKCWAVVALGLSFKFKTGCGGLEMVLHVNNGHR